MKNYRIIAFVLIIILISACCRTNNEEKTTDERTRYFPKQELKAENIPDKANLWVFLLAGQSNMAGRGQVEPQDTLPNERILSINKNGELILAKEPLNFYEPTMNGLDCGLSFGRSLIEQIPDSISVLIIPAAVGGSSISKWLGDSIHRNVKLLTNFREKAETGMQYGEIKGILWHQGESDANKENVTQYYERLSKLMATFRKIVQNENLSIFIGELGSYSDDELWKEINKQIKEYTLKDPNTYLIHTQDLKDKGDQLHFNTEGQRILGERFAGKFLELKE